MRRRRYNLGRWRLERERHRLPDEAPVERDADFPLADVVAAWTRKLSASEYVWLNELETAWTEVVGAAVASHARPGRYGAGVLTVFVDHSVWLSELERYGRTDILVQAAEAFSPAGDPVGAISTRPRGGAPEAGYGASRFTSGMSFLISFRRFGVQIACLLRVLHGLFGPGILIAEDRGGGHHARQLRLWTAARRAQ